MAKRKVRHRALERRQLIFRNNQLSNRQRPTAQRGLEIFGSFWQKRAAESIPDWMISESLQHLIGAFVRRKYRIYKTCSMRPPRTTIVSRFKSRVPATT